MHVIIIQFDSIMIQFDSKIDTYFVFFV